VQRGLIVSVPLVEILGAIVFMTCRYMDLRVWQAMTAIV
jgi:hypothetical protein